MICRRVFVLHVQGVSVLRFSSLLLAVVLVQPARAVEPLLVTITIADHRFVPAEVRVPAGRKLRLLIENRDASAEEFECYDLDREKVVTGNGRISVWVGPLEPGRYPFFGEFHPETAQGVLIAQ